MAKHRYPNAPIAWHKVRRHLIHKLEAFTYWLHQQQLELQDIAAELKERTNRGH